METKNRFNLIEEPWIPVAGFGLASLKDIFKKEGFHALGGNPVQKIALMKLLLAICQAAATPEDEDAWKKTGVKGLAKKVLLYLEEQKERFWLYGKTPFLQMPGIVKAAVQPFGAVLPDISTGNTTVLNQSQAERPLSDAERALLLIQLMGFALGGKKTDNSVVLSNGYTSKQNDKGKPSTGKPGVSLGFLGHLHSFITGDNLLQTIWLNIFTNTEIESHPMFPSGIGVAPWETMPKGENCKVAEKLRSSLMGRLLPLCRFILLEENGLHYSEGLAHPGYKEGMADPSMTVDYSGKDPKTIWCDPEKRPWRSLTAILSFIETQKGFECFQVSRGILRTRKFVDRIGIWSGGLRVSSNAGEQYVSGSDEYVESEIIVESKVLGQSWFSALKLEMDAMDRVSRSIYGCVAGYFKFQNCDGTGQAGQASGLFWQLCERRFQDLVDACAESSGEAVKALRPVFASIGNKVYNDFCPKETARQIDAWAANRLQVGWYLNGDSIPVSKIGKTSKEA